MDAYERRQSERDDEYVAAFESPEFIAWRDNLSPEERQQAEAAGILEPHIDGKAGGVSDCDLADSPLASYDPTDGFGEPEGDQEGGDLSNVGTERIWEILRRVIGELKSPKNPGLTIECAALASGLAYQGDSQQEIATRHGVTRAAVSKRCVEFCNAIGLEPSRAMRSLEAREAYQRARNKSLGKEGA